MAPTRTYGPAVAVAACAGAGTAFLLPSGNGSAPPVSHGHPTKGIEGNAGSTLSVAMPLALGTVAVAAARNNRRQTSTRAVQQRAPLLTNLEDAIQNKLEERLKRQHQITSEMQRNNDAFKKKLEEELSSHMRMKDQLKTRIRALQTIYDDANDKLELSQSLSQKSKDSCSELEDQVGKLERNLREVEQKNRARISQLEGESKEKEVKLDQLTMATGRLHESIRELKDTREVERKEATERDQQIRQTLQLKQTALQQAMHQNEQVQTELRSCRDQLEALTQKVAAAEGALLAQNNKNQEMESQLKIAPADTARPTWEEEKLLREKKVALAREKLVQDSFKKTEEREKALKEILPLMEKDERNLKDRISMLEGQATNEKVLSFKLQESEQENSKLAAEVKRMQEALKAKDAEKIRLTQDIKKAEDASVAASRDAQAKQAAAAEAQKQMEVRAQQLMAAANEAKISRDKAIKEAQELRAAADQAKFAALRAADYAKEQAHKDAADLAAKAIAAAKAVEAACANEVQLSQQAAQAQQTVQQFRK
mmetsp:Transcript_61200/g.134005  ORF Transcript_61200/g.134005 Transcript_61200/m.134005 type:complete len:541 (-) Transcript_61200:108-1730(-)